MQMDERAKEARRAYAREYRRKNPEKVAATQNRYWLKKAAERSNQEKVLPVPDQTEPAE